MPTMFTLEPSNSPLVRHAWISKFDLGREVPAVSREYLSYHKLSLINIILFRAPGAKASTMVIWITQLSSSTEYLSMYAYIYCVWLKMLIILQTQELSWLGSLFVQVVIIRGINFGHYLTLLRNKALCLKITQKDLTLASNVLGH